MGKHHPDTFLPRTIQIGLMPCDRAAIEAQIETLISFLDNIDGDPDLEPDHEDYDACDAGEMQEYLSILPVYDIDQSIGPTNIEEAFETQKRIAQAGMEHC